MMLKLKHVSKRYDYQKVLNDVSLTLPRYGLVSIVGPSGCGKSTLLHIIGGIDHDFLGDILYQNESVKHHLSKYRKQHVSFIFQQFHLIMWLSVHYNIDLSKCFAKQSSKDNHLDISEFDTLKISSLSQGQRQRVAYLRAYQQSVDILLCDEPTGSLDPTLADAVMKLLKAESKERLVVLVSHDKALVEKYSDEIYEMCDGTIIQHHIINSIEGSMLLETKKRKIRFSCLKLSILSLLSHRFRSFQLVLGMTLSLLCILLTLTVSRGLESQIHDYIYSIVPPLGISFQMSQHQSLSQEFCLQLESLSSIDKVQLYLDDYECLGIGFVEERYQQSQVLFIGDDTSPFTHLSLQLGRYPVDDYEIIVSLSTAKHLCGENDIDELIGKKVFAWYKYGYEVKSIAYHIVGISSQSTTLDTIYQKSNAYIHLLKDVYFFDDTQVQASLGILYVNPDYQRHDVFEQLQNDYPEYRFLEIGASTNQKVSDTMEKVQFILCIFSLLAILSSLFLIGEVMFLNVIQKKKDLAIMKCFGANTFHLMKIVFFESFMITLLSQILASIFYFGLLMVVNDFIEDMLFIHSLKFNIDIFLLAGVYGICFLLVFISQIPPLLYVIKLNTIHALKG